jgi:cytoskeletal protein RodZ
VLGPATLDAVTIATGPIVAGDAASAEAPPATQTGLTSGTMTRMGKKASKLGAVLGVTAVAATGAALLLMVGARGPSPRSASATAPDPVINAVSSSTSEPASDPPASETASAPTVAIPELDTTTADASANPASAKPGRYAHPVRAGTKRPGTGEPHISDKPRY